MTFNSSISGKYYKLTSSDVKLYTLRADGKFAGTSGGTDTAVVLLTGWQTVSAMGNTMYQTYSGEYIDLSQGWQETGQAANYTRQQAQQLVNAIIRNNEVILCNNLLCARFAHRLTRTQQQQLYELQTRLTERNAALSEDGLVDVQETATPLGYAELESSLNSFMQKGVGSVTLALVIAAVVVASLSTAAYFAYQYYYRESEQDVKFSNSLTKTLTSKLTEEEYAQLKAETQGLVTKAKIQARLGGGTSKLFMYAGLGLAVLGVISYLRN